MTSKINLESRDKLTINAVDNTLSKIDMVYDTDGDSHRVAVETVGLCYDWSETIEGDSVLPKKKAARKALRAYVKKEWELQSEGEGEAGWMKSIAMWLVMKFVVPWVIRNFLNELYMPT